MVTTRQKQHFKMVNFDRFCDFLLNCSETVATNLSTFFQIKIIQTVEGDMVIVPWEDPEQMLSTSAITCTEDFSKVSLDHTNPSFT